MKKNRANKKATEKDMLPEYSFDYSKARPNRFAGRMKRGSRAVVLDPDVAEPHLATGIMALEGEGAVGHHAAFAALAALGGCGLGVVGGGLTVDGEGD